MFIVEGRMAETVLDEAEKVIYLLRTATSSPKCKATTTAWLHTLRSQAVAFNGGDNSEGWRARG